MTRLLKQSFVDVSLRCTIYSFDSFAENKLMTMKYHLTCSVIKVLDVLSAAC